MRVSIFGLGYVGCVTAACLASLGHQVIGVEINDLKLDMLSKGISPILEKGIEDLMQNCVSTKMFTVTSDWKTAVGESDIALVCVGTPSRANGSIDLTFVERVSEQIGLALKDKDEYLVVGIRSTVLPGTVDQVVVPILANYSGKDPGKDFGVCMVPEFLREGSSIEDFYHPARNVIGEYDTKSGDTISQLFRGIKAPLIRTTIKTAEIVKYADNSFHALKISFANEIGNICKELSIDSHTVMDIFCKDDKLNLSPYYLKPGFAFGGSCLPKDLRAITYQSKMQDLDTPLLNAILKSNKSQILKVVNKLLEYKGSKLGFLGLSFKSGTDDLRESPLVELIETLLGKGFSIRIYDKYVSLAKLIGANKEYIEREIPHISSLMVSTPKEAIKYADVIVVGHNDDAYKNLISEEIMDDQVVVDLVRLVHDSNTIKGEYYGICW